MRDRFFIITFLIILLLPFLDSVFAISPVKDLFEKRQNAAKPNLPQNLAQLEEFPQKFNDYFNDNYGFRKSFITLNGLIMDKVFNQSPDSRAVKGKDNWLYFDNYNSLLDAMKKASLEQELIEKSINALAKNWHEAQKRNIKYLLVIAADKSTIYPEFLPDYIANNIDEKGQYRIDKFLNFLKKKYPDFPILDLRKILLKAKEKEIIYHKTDTHWNRRGAHYGYVEIMKSLNIKPKKRDQFTNKQNSYIRGDISDIMGLDLQNLDYDLTPKFKAKAKIANDLPSDFRKFHRPNLFINNDKKLPNLFVFHDSFFGNLFSFTSEHFKNSFYVNEFPCNLDYQIITKYDPDIVIQQFWEGRIKQVLKRCK